MKNDFVNLYSSKGKGKGLSMSKSKSKNFFEKLYSGYWMGNSKYTQFNPDDTYSLVKMAAFRRSVADFVYIVTGKHIPVKYNTLSNESFTDGKVVVISANFKNDEVDAIVGVAQHEGTHIVKTDMDYFRNIERYIPKRIFDEAETRDKKRRKRINVKSAEKLLNQTEKKLKEYGDEIKANVARLKEALEAKNLQEIITAGKSLERNLNKNQVKKKVHRLLNWIEDRRIDNWQIRRAPGYKPYYRSFYNKYFRHPIVDMGLMSTAYRDESYEAYSYRITNFLNKNTDLDALKGLREIWDTIDLRHINRLLRTKDSFEIAVDVWDIIMKYMKESTNNKEDTSKGDGDSDDATPENKDNLNDDWEESGDRAVPQEISDEDFDKMLEKIESGELKQNKNGVPIKLSKEQQEKLEKALEKQKNFLDGAFDKGTPLTPEQEDQLNRIEKSGTSIEEASTDSHHSQLSGSPDKVPVIVVRELTEANINDTPMGYGHSSTSESAVERGITMGSRLARKLIIRNESRKTILTRKRTGRIDRRLLSGIGCGTSSIFQQKYVDQFGEALIHISIDASSSMRSSSKWRNALTTGVALAKAAEVVKNLDVIMSFRTTTSSDDGGDIPYILIAYDSRKDSFVKIRSLFPKLSPSNYTPEGLCFEAIMKDIIQSMERKDGLFVNFSDGEPYLPNPAFSSAKEYGGEPAHRQTRFQVNKMLRQGIKVLSFFIDGGSYSDFSGFQSAYGAGAKNIDTQSITAVASEINKMFVDSNKKYRKNI